jgi:hypothetical protein
MHAPRGRVIEGRPSRPDAYDHGRAPGRRRPLAIRAIKEAVNIQCRDGPRLALRNPTFGPVAVVGAGVTLVELHGAVAISPAPVSVATAHAMLARLSIRPLLEGWGGDAGAYLDAPSSIA